MEKVAVFPVPDCACAITSWPTSQGQCFDLKFKAENLTFDNGHDGTLLNGRRALETVSIDTYTFC